MVDCLFDKSVCKLDTSNSIDVIDDATFVLIVDWDDSNVSRISTRSVTSDTFD